LALAQKVIERVTAAGLPADLMPAGLVAIGRTYGSDPENAVRAQALDFVDVVRTVEQSILASRSGTDLEDAQLGAVTEEEWRAHWPS
jgi:XTP/dITP diphosphohydrolase